MKTMKFGVALAGLAMGWLMEVQGQLGPQDRYYVELEFGNAGPETLSAPMGTAVTSGPNYEIFIVDSGHRRVAVFTQEGDYLRSIGPNFGPGESFVAPAGIDIRDGRVLVTDIGRNGVYRFQTDGTYIDKLVAPPGQDPMNPVDVCATDSGAIYVLSRGSSPVLVFLADGTFDRGIIESGALDFKLGYPMSLDVSAKGEIFVSDIGSPSQKSEPVESIKVFDAEGNFLGKVLAGLAQSIKWGGGYANYGPTTVRIGPNGLVHAIVSCYNRTDGHTGWEAIYSHWVFSRTPTGMTLLGIYDVGQSASDGGILFNHTSMCVAQDGSVFVSNPTHGYATLRRSTFRTQFHPGVSDSIPQPEVISGRLRANSAIVDIHYRVHDLDDNEHHVALLAFRDGTIDLAHLKVPSTFVENTGNYLGPGIDTTQDYTIQWDSGADWGEDLVTFKTAVAAKESDRELIDIHYLDLPSEDGSTALTISRSPLVQEDFLPVWFWLLATGDGAISLNASGEVHGVGGAYDGVLLASVITTTAEGRAFVLERMGLREATPSELRFARLATNPELGAESTISKWAPVIRVAGKPLAVNEWGFDTGDWGANAWWAVKVPPGP